MMADDFSDLPPSVRRFRRCPGCSFDWATREGNRVCNYHYCAYLPPELEVTCDWCGFNFVTDDGHVRCNHDACPHALRLKGNVRTDLRWKEWMSSESA